MFQLFCEAIFGLIGTVLWKLGDSAINDLNKKMVEKDIKSHGGNFLSMTLIYREFLSRDMYSVNFKDKQGCQHQGTCNVSIFSGIEWVDDQVVGLSDRD